MSEKTTTTVEDESLAMDLESVELLSADELEGSKARKGAEGPEQEEPRMTSPEWSDWVMTHFTENELDPNSGNPMVHGLRRVARLLLGPIIYSGADPIQCPSLLGGFEKTTMLQPAVVAYTVKILMCRLESGMSEAYEATFRDVADVYFGNTDPDFARHPSATASTKAEARCLRKALQLRTAAWEETTKVPLDMAAMDGMIDMTQMNFINVLCSRNNINVTKFMNSGNKKYDRLEDVPYGTAAKMIEHLSGLQNSGKVPENIKGFEKGKK